MHKPHKADEAHSCNTCNCVLEFDVKSEKPLLSRRLANGVVNWADIKKH